MTQTVAQLCMSLDGFVAGPDQSLENPIGVGGMAVMQWLLHVGEPGHEADAGLRDELVERGGAYVMGRNMFGPVRGAWDSDHQGWRGWWGDEPPYHAPVYVLTHHPHEPMEMAGGTTFHFVTQGFAAAHALAREAAGDRDVDVAGGGSTVRQALGSGLLDELVLHVVPVLLGRGERLLDGLDDPGLTPIGVVESPHVTHIRYRVGRG